MSRYKLFDRSKLKIKSVLERESKIDTSIIIDPESEPKQINDLERKIIFQLASDIKFAKSKGASLILAYGAHLFRNGCSPIMIKLMEQGYITQLLTNGAGIIHDFEMALLGKTTEDVERYVSQGQFGIWEETGKLINQCVNLGASSDKGYGECIGEMISEERLGFEKLNFPYKNLSIVGTAYQLGIPLSVGVSIGNDITFNHPICNGANVGKTSFTDFLIFANAICNLENGVFTSVGSAIMSPMIFEKSLAMANNLELQEKGKKIENYHILVNDIQPGEWDWSKGEPPKTNPAYYLRFCKSFSRMGGKFDYLCMDNRKFIHNLYWALK